MGMGGIIVENLRILTNILLGPTRREKGRITSM
jgi:hypothetical protein